MHAQLRRCYPWTARAPRLRRQWRTSCCSVGSASHEFYPVNGPHKTDEEIKELVRSANMGSQRDWEFITMLAGSFLDENAVLILGKLLGLPDIQIVHEDIAKSQLYDATEVPEEELGPLRPLSGETLGATPPELRALRGSCAPGQIIGGMHVV